MTNSGHGDERGQRRCAGARSGRAPTCSRLVAIVVITAMTGAALLAHPASRVRLDAAALTFDVLDLGLPTASRTAVDRRTTSIGNTTVDMYGRHHIGRVIVLVPGAAPQGRDDERVVALAEAAARQGRMVVVPELDVYGERLTTADIERIRAVAGDLAVEHGPVVLAGISFGGSLSLLAAADSRAAEDVALVATLGAYGDLLAVAESALVGHVTYRGDTYLWDADPRAPQVVADELVRMLDDAEADAVRRVLDGEEPADTLTEELAAVVGLIGADDQEAFHAAARHMPDALHEVIATFSPIRHAESIAVPVVAMHARDDPVIPYVELIRLESALDEIEALHLDGFGHVGIELASPRELADALGDLRGVWRFATRLLAAERG